MNFTSWVRSYLVASEHLNKEKKRDKLRTKIELGISLPSTLQRIQAMNSRFAPSLSNPKPSSLPSSWAGLGLLLGEWQYCNSGIEWEQNRTYEQSGTLLTDLIMCKLIRMFCTSFTWVPRINPPTDEFVKINFWWLGFRYFTTSSGCGFH